MIFHSVSRCVYLSFDRSTDQVEPAFRDYVNDIPDRDASGYGNLHYTNQTGRNDFDTMKVAEDSAFCGVYCPLQKN